MVLIHWAIVSQPRKLSKKRYLPAKSKSHDAGDELVGGCGTARARIARQGARGGGGGGGGSSSGERSRSPSHSPARLDSSSNQPQPNSPVSGMPTSSSAGIVTSAASGALPPSSCAQAYVAKCDSVESLNCGESAALLNMEDTSRSQTSLLIYFDDKDMQDTVV